MMEEKLPTKTNSDQPRVFYLKFCSKLSIIITSCSYRLAWSRTQAFQAWYPGSNPGGSVMNKLIKQFRTNIEAEVAKTILQGRGIKGVT